MKLTVKREVDVKYLSLTVAVRYEDEDMPFNAPLRDGESWSATIDLDEAKVLFWPLGHRLEFFMKVCDCGTYRLLDTEQNEVARIENNYVPNRLLPGEYGDYLALDIDRNGTITNWLKNPTLKDFEEQGGD